jgi:hypothetical protein
MPISSFFIHPSAFKTCLWFLAKNKKADAKRGFRGRFGVENLLALAS